MPAWDWILELTNRPDIYGNTAQRWLAAVGVALAVAIVLRLVKSVLARRIGKIAEKTDQNWPTFVRGLLDRTRAWFLLVVGLYCGSRVLDLPEDKAPIVQSIAIVVLLLQAALWGNALLNFYVIHYSRQRLATDAASATTVSVLGFLAKLALWAIVVLTALSNLGIDVTALVAGLGIGGIAVALAAQNVLGDLFASLAIMLDRPFVLGDFIAVDGFQGTVLDIGIKTTRLRSLSGEELVFSNSDLLKSRLRNYKRMTERRVLFTVGVTYDTPRDKVARIAPLLREIVERQSPVRFDRAHFQSLGDSALLFEVVYFALTANYSEYMDIQQAINLAILDEFASQEIEIAYPTQTVFVKGSPEFGVRSAE
jgi:small-conductance mechanosensitive channel